MSEDERKMYLTLIDLSPHFIDRVEEVDYAKIAGVLGLPAEGAGELYRAMYDDYLASRGLTREAVLARMQGARRG